MDGPLEFRHKMQRLNSPHFRFLRTWHSPEFEEAEQTLFRRGNAGDLYGLRYRPRRTVSGDGKLRSESFGKLSISSPALTSLRRAAPAGSIPPAVPHHGARHCAAASLIEPIAPR
jgi:hypothetical protein